MELNFSTNRFLIRNIRVEDVGAEYLSWFKNDDVKKYIHFHMDEQKELQELKDYVFKKTNDPKILFLGVFNKANPSEHIGNIKFEPFNIRIGVAVMGILIGNQAWKGKGVGFEVLSSCMEKIEGLGILKTFLGVESSNHSAIKLYEKCKFINDDSNYLNLNLKNHFCMVRYSSNLNS